MTPKTPAKGAAKRPRKKAKTRKAGPKKRSAPPKVSRSRLVWRGVTIAVKLQMAVADRAPRPVAHVKNQKAAFSGTYALVDSEKQRPAGTNPQNFLHNSCTGELWSIFSL
jgi:hypothetical protein